MDKRNLHNVFMVAEVTKHYAIHTERVRREQLDSLLPAQLVNACLRVINVSINQPIREHHKDINQSQRITSVSMRILVVVKNEP